MLEKRFSLDAKAQERLYSKMLDSMKRKPKGKDTFCIMMPPPNVTGVLHLGHALTYTLQDILTRYKLLKGYDVLFQPGLDHAGIATQIVVLKELEKEGITHPTRDQFMKKARSWKDYSAGKIVDQQKKIGILAAWDRSRFTMDDHYAKSVSYVFKKLYEAGLIYKDKRLVNWDITLQTAVSDLEVIDQDTKGHMYYIRYSPDIVVATTRPETLLGDTAVAVHPEDARYKPLIGREITVPICSRTIKIVADEYCDPEKGTGAVKITPAHDFNDFEVGRRLNLDVINILNKDGTLNDNVPVDYRGLTLNDAREKIIKELEGQGLLEKIEEITHAVPFSDRTNTRIEPFLMDQWFMDMRQMAQDAMHAAQEGDVRFVPENWQTTYVRWLEGIRPWCISRQLWWGHQIPVWYGPDSAVFVEETEEKALEKARAQFGADVVLKREQDVLDTWFSSALWPFVTLGWPDERERFDRFFPTSVLITGFDIIFFWVARMVMLSLHFTKKAPFKDVYIHALVRDEKGQKMSKSRGNIIDPLVVMDKFGCDTLRLTLCALSVPGRDINLGYQKIEGYQHFITKMWNAGRFLLSQDEGSAELLDLDTWVMGKFDVFLKNTEDALDAYRFDLMVKHLYSFFWTQFCDIYLEGMKGKHSRAAKTVYTRFLSVASCIMPFVTQELRHHIDGLQILDEGWPEPFGAECQKLDDLIDGVFVLRRLPIANASITHKDEAFLKDNLYVVQNLSGFKDMKMGKLYDMPLVQKDATFFMEGDKAGFQERITFLEKEMAALEKIVSNQRFKESNESAWLEKSAKYQTLDTEYQALKHIHF